MAFFIWVQDAAFSAWIRESDWAIFAILIVHTLSMAFLAGTSFAVVLRTLGIAPGIPLVMLARFNPILVIGLVTAIVSGILLVMGYPAKALTNPLFYIKLVLLIAAWLVTRRLFGMLVGMPADSRSELGPATAARGTAIIALLLWLAVITAGKFLAYTNTLLLVYE